MKKFTAMLLSLVLSFSLLTAGTNTACRAQEPDPTPIVTLGPKDPKPSVEPQDDPLDPPKPPIEKEIS